MLEGGSISSQCFGDRLLRTWAWSCCSVSLSLSSIVLILSLPSADNANTVSILDVDFQEVITDGGKHSLPGFEVKKKCNIHWQTKNKENHRKQYAVHFFSHQQP